MFDKILKVAGLGLQGAGLFKKDKSDKMADLNYSRQKEFAQNSIQWRVDDAKKAGIHPLYALGGNGNSFQPSGYYGNDSDALSGFGQSLYNAGVDYSNSQQDIMTETMKQEQLKGLQLENKSKELEILKQQKALLSFGQSPAFNGLNPFATPNNSLAGSLMSDSGQQTTAGVRQGFGIDKPIMDISFVPRANGSITIQPSEKRQDFVSESLLDKLDFYADRLLNIGLYRDIIDKALGTDSDISTGFGFVPEIVPRKNGKSRASWYQKPIYDFRKKRWFWQ